MMQFPIPQVGGGGKSFYELSNRGHGNLQATFTCITSFTHICLSYRFQDRKSETMASPGISRIQAIGWPLLTFTPLEGMSAVVLQFMPAEFRPDLSD